MNFLRDRAVFSISATIIVLVLVSSLFFGPQLDSFSKDLFSITIENFGWFFILSMSFFLFVALYCCVSSVGQIRLGPDDSRPEFSYLSWFSMLFSAGMGIGLLFYGVAEPMLHFSRPAPMASGGAPILAARNAMGLTFFHWGLHPWACYSIMALIIAYFTFRKGKPLSLRYALFPLFGSRVNGTFGNLIDVIAVVATLFGVATSLGLGATQINSGMHSVFGLPVSSLVQLSIIAIITTFATISVVSGLDKGIRILSELNMGIAFLILLAVFIMGPTVFLLDFFVENIGSYLSTLIRNSFWTASLDEKKHEWLGNWTIFYWAWWVSWAPFVGTFLARISKGRTVKEFVIGVLLVPTTMCLVWFTVFGGTALHQEINGVGGELLNAINSNVSTALFVFLDRFPFAIFFKILVTISIILFFVTSSDSASLVIDILSSNGVLNPSIKTKIFWAVTEGAVAAVLLTLGGLKALQTAAVCVGLPFCFILVLATIGLLKEFAKEKSLIKKS